MPRSRPPYSPEYRQQMVDLELGGRTPESLSREFEPTAQSIWNWIRQAERDEGTRFGVGRQEVRKAIEKTAGRHGLPDSGSQMARQSRQLHRARSGSVHGRAASIMRAYFEESAPTGLWLGGRRERRRTA